MDEYQKIIYDLLGELKEDQKQHGRELAQQSIYLAKMEVSLNQNTVDLSEHKEGVVQCRVLIENNAKRLERLEMPKKLIKFFLNKYTVVVGALTATLGLILLALNLL